MTEDMPRKTTLILVIGEDVTAEEVLMQFEHALLWPASHIRVRES